MEKEKIVLGIYWK